MADVFIGSRTQELRVFTGSAEDAQEFAAALVLPAGLEIRIEDDPVSELTSRIVAAIDVEHPYATIAIADTYQLSVDMKRLRATIARAERLRDIWLTCPPDDMHHAAGIMLAKYLSGEAFQVDAPTEETDG